jgi:alkane 1-monooxygenase
MRNAMLWYIACPVALFIVPLWVALGTRAVAFFFAQAVMAVTLLEQVNAIEHYGLRRKLRDDGSYESIGPQHSWDAPYTISNHIMFMLQLHSDHHLNPGKRYQCLERSHESPQLPAGYLVLAPCLLVPPLWRAIMDPVLLRYLEKHSKGN